MRFTPHLRDLNWLVARPIAHRGLHAGKAIENTESAFAAAIKHNYAIECDLQITADGEAVVFHDDEVGRLLEDKGMVKHHTSKQLKGMPFKSGGDRVQTLAELLEQVDCKVTLVIELKSHWDNNQALTHRVLEVLHNYNGPCALMSFDPEMIACVAEISPVTVRGITADRVVDPYYNPLSLARRLSMRNFSHLPRTKPHFVSFDFNGLPFAPITEIRNAGHPVISWTIESSANAADALRYSDQITFQGYHPG
jgi:glycerophosphoryl diester phosphodiesterase